jgi:hypothetical protein
LTGMALTARQDGWRCPVRHKHPCVLYLFPGCLLTLA